MQLIKRIFSVLLISIVLASCSSSNTIDSTNILFIGNSYTYYNSSPELVKAMIQEKFPNRHVEVELVSQGGMTLERHWEDQLAIDAIRKGDWDYVVLQEQSKLGKGLIIDNEMYFGETDLFFEYARKFDKEIKKVGAETVFFMTWSTKNRPNEQGILTHAYTEIGKELEAIVAPVGLVWSELRTQNDFDLYDFDGSHPSIYGSFVVASAIFTTILNENPLGLSDKISGFRLASDGTPSIEKDVLLSISPKVAKKIQETSWKIVSELNSEGGYEDLKQPSKTYIIPLIKGADAIINKTIEGRWYGISTYSNSYLGLILDVESKNEKLDAKLSFYTPDRIDKIVVKSVLVDDDVLKIVIFDKFRNMNSEIEFSLSNDRLNGVSESFGGNLKNYKHWSLSKSSVSSKVNLESLDALIDLFGENIDKLGYIKSAIQHYKDYSKLIDSEYLPEENYLNGMGYIYLRDKEVQKALNVLELAMVLYPKSVAAYNSYGAALNESGQVEKAIEIYLKGVELAKEIESSDLEDMLIKLKTLSENKIIQTANPPPPPPPNR